MNDDRLISDGTAFRGYTIEAKLSRHHEGEREVYLATDTTNEKVVITVYNLEEGRFATDPDSATPNADFIDEVHYLLTNARPCTRNANILIPVANSGLATLDGRRCAFMVQPFLAGYDTLDFMDDIYSSRVCRETPYIIQQIGNLVSDVNRFTNGGGIYNLSYSNILARFDDPRRIHFKVIGLGCIGPEYEGNAPLDRNCLDPMFSPSEAFKGSFGKYTDIYSLGMLYMRMIIGNYMPDVYEQTPDSYRLVMLDKMHEHFEMKERLILSKATCVTPLRRFATVDKFMRYMIDYNSKFNSVATRSETHVTTDTGISSGTVPATDVTTEAATHYVIKTNTRRRKPGVNGLDDVAGMESLKALFHRDFIRIVRNPEVARAYGITPSNATLLYGPQGCGKTFIAERAAVESGLSYRVIHPSDLGSIYIHGAQQKIAETFEKAEAEGPMILIFDEFDALVPKRDGDTNEHQANEVNEMLTRLNNCAERGVYCLCTTNRPDRIDPAVMRKGRIDRSIFVPLPDHAARCELFRLSLANRPVAGEIDLDRLADETENYTCSDITFIVDEVARLCFDETLDKGLDSPAPITLERILSMISATVPSVTEEQRIEFLRLKEKMEKKDAVSARRKVGFTI